MNAFRILTAILLLSGCSRAGSGNDQTPGPIALVTLARAEPGAITQTATLYGATEPGAFGKQTLSAPAEAIVAQIVTPVGTRVKRGAVVARLSPGPNTRLDLAKASADARAADAAYARAQRLRADGLVGDAEVESARAAAQAADATRTSLSDRAHALTLRAPGDGFVEAVAASPGDLVQPGAAIATIAKPGDQRARFGADPAVARALYPGQPIRIEAAAGRAAFSVPIQSVDPVVDPQTRLASIFADLPASAGLTLGETLTGTVAIGGSGTALIIPYDALLDDGGQPYVFVVTDGVAHRHDVEAGAVAGGRIAITKGVTTGAEVVIQGGTAIEDGMKVRTR